MHPSPRAIEEAHEDLPKIVLREFSGQAFKAHQGTHRPWAHRRDQVIQRGLAAGVPFQLGSAQNLDGQQLRLTGQDLRHDRSERLRLRRTANAATLPFLRVIDIRDAWFSVDPTHASNADADQPRDVAAVRGSVVHKLIETNVTLDRLGDDVIERAFENQWAKERRKVKWVLLPDDYHFVRNCMRQYWHMRSQMPFVILAQEPQVWNLTAGYAGSADVLLWFLGDWVEVGDDENGEPVYEFAPLEGQDVDEWQRKASKGQVDYDVVQQVGGTIALGDWKTSKGVYTDHVTQMHAYLAAEFVGNDGKRDERLSALLEAMMEAVLIHIRPDGCHVDFAPWNKRVLYGFLGSVAFARFLADYPKPDALFSHSLAFEAPDTEESTYVDEA